MSTWNSEAPVHQFKLIFDFRGYWDIGMAGVCGNWSSEEERLQRWHRACYKSSLQCVMPALELADVCVLCNFFLMGKAAIFTP